LKECEFALIASRRLSGIILSSIKPIKSRMKNHSYHKWSESCILSVNYCWLALLFKTICMNYGLCLIFCCLKFSAIVIYLIIGSKPQAKVKEKDKAKAKCRKKMYKWSVSFIKYLNLSCCVEPNYKWRKIYLLKNKYISMWA